MQKYLRKQSRDVFNPPKWVITPGVTLRIGQAAKVLEIPYQVLRRNLNEYGLTIYRDKNGHRHFLRSEVMELKRIIDNLKKKDVARNKDGVSHVLEVKI